MKTTSLQDTFSSQIENFININNLLPLPVALIQLDSNLTFLHANNAFAEIIEYSQSEIFSELSNSLLFLTLSSDREILHSAIFECKSSGKKKSFLAKISNKLNSYKILNFSVQILHQSTDLLQNGKSIENNSENQTIIITAQNVCEHINLADELKREKEFISVLQDISFHNTFDYDVVSQKIYLSKNLAIKLQLPEIIENPSTAFLDIQLLAPDSLNIFNYYIDQEIGKDYEKEIHFIVKNSKHLWYNVTYRIVGNEKNEKVRIIGALTDITKQKETMRDLVEKSEQDQLTKLYNKITTEYLINESLKKRRLLDNGYALMIVDIDNFKEINDTFGHLFGDEVLKSIASDLKMLFRADDVLGRIGGDEFFIFVKNFQSFEFIEKKSNSVCAAFRRTYTDNGKCVEISSSIGIAFCPNHGKTFEELYKSADLALYEAKKLGKNRFVLFDEKASYLNFN